MPKALIAAFSPEIDSPGDVARDLAFEAPNASIDGLMITALELPRSWNNAFPILENELKNHWDVLLLVAGSDLGSLAIERLALNECDGREKDGEGRRPLSKKITLGGDPGYWTGLPYRELVISMSAKGVPSFASHNPGGGVPNLVFYKLMEFVARSEFPSLSGLVHLPFIDSLRFMSKVVPERILPLLLQSIFELNERDDRLAFDMNRLAHLKESPTP